jgi:hypothetical protein
MQSKVPFTKRFVFAYKDSTGWFIDDTNGFSKADNQLIAGIPEIIEELVGNKVSRVRINYSDSIFDGASTLKLISSSSTGSVYEGTINGRELRGWLCPVFFYYFSSPPEKLHIRIEPI